MEDAVGGEHPDQPTSSRADENVQTISEIVRKDHHLSVGMLAEIMNIERVRQILHE